MPLAENISERLTLKAYSSGAITAATLADPDTDLVATGGQILRFVNHDFSRQAQDIQNPEKRSDRQAPLGRQGTGRVQGTLRGLLSPGTYGDLFEAATRGTWVAPPVLTESDLTSITADHAAGKFIFGGGDPEALGLKVGHVFRLTNTAEADNNGIDFFVLALGGSNNREVTVYPAPTDATADTSFTLTCRGAEIEIPSSGHVSRKFGLESYQQDLDRAELFEELRVGGFNLQTDADANVLIDFPMLGRSRRFYDTGSSPFFSAPAAQTSDDVCGPIGGILRVAGQNLGIVTGFSLAMTMNPNGPAVRGQKFVPEIFLGPAQISGNLSFFLDDNAYDLLQTFDNEERIQLLLWVTNSQSAASDGLTFLLPYTQLGSLQKQDDGSGGKVCSGPFTAGPYAGTPPVGVTASALQIVDTKVAA